MYRMLLHIFPLIQMISFISGLLLLDSHIYLAIILFFFAALFLNFSLHITIHHFVHFRYKSNLLNLLIESVYSIFLALPFSFYRMQHFNHHRYDNRIGDITSTWEKKNETIVARSFFNYSFFWFLKGSAKKAIETALRDGDINKKEKQKIQIQFLIILVVFIFLIVLNPWFGLAYASMFYIGWSLVAITNYGQHLPLKYDSTAAYSYHNSMYNFLFFKNGLHLEHHLEPHLNYHELTSKNQSKIKWPHLITAFFRNK